MLYAYSSAGGNNGSAFAGFGADTPFLNLTLGGAMLLARFLPITGILAIAGSMVQKKKLAVTAGTLSTSNGMFVFLLIVIVLLMWYPKRKQTTPLQWRWTIFLTGFLLTVSDFLYFYALSDPEALLSVLSPIRRSGVVFTFVVGAILFHERQIKVKAAILAVVLAGTMLLYFG